MKAKKRQKLCHHCEGEVDLDVIVCPYCAADLREERPEQPRFNTTVSSVKGLQTEQSLYPPAHSEQKPQTPLHEDLASEMESEEPELTASAPLKSAIGGVLLFALGAQAFCLGMAFLILSDRGMLLLQFNANWWPLCVILSIPLLIFGYRYTKNV